MIATIRTALLSSILLSIAGFSGVGYAADDAIVNVYSSRQENLIKPLLDQFTQATGIQVNLVTGQADTLLARLQSEGKNSPVDLIITTDVGHLYRAQSSNLLRCVGTQGFEHIPKSYRDPNGCWFGLSLRVRAIMHVKDIAALYAVTDYESLADPKLKGRICIRSSSNIYNQSFVASMIATHGEMATLRWLKGFVANFARPPSGGDRDQILAAANGLCDIAIANTYYLAMMLDSNQKEHKKSAENMQVIFPNKNGRGAHTNISGAGISLHAPHPDHALTLLKYLSNPSSQEWYVRTNYEYPISAGVPVPTILKSWGDFKRDTAHLHRLGELNDTALKLMNKAGWH